MPSAPLSPVLTWARVFRVAGEKGSSRSRAWAFLWAEKAAVCWAVREEGPGSGGWKGAPQRSSGGFGHWAGLQALAPQSLGPRPAWQGRSHVSALLLFLAGSWDMMTVSILETLFKAGEIARSGGKNTTTSSNFIPTHGNYSNRDL